MADIESTPLLVNTTTTTTDSNGGYSDDINIDNSYDNNTTTSNIEEKSSTTQTCLNLIKIMIGTGVLAIPFAATQGGLIFHIIGLAVVTIWNSYSVYCLDRSKIYIDTNTTMTDSYKKTIPKNTSTFGLITWHAFGTVALHCIDFVFGVFMFGLLIAYEDAILGFAADTPLTTGHKRNDATCLLIVLLPILTMKDYSAISKISAFGTSILFAIFGMIAIYGLQQHGFDGFDTTTFCDRLNLYPASFTAFSNWFGVAAFSFGIVPFVYSVQGSMQQPTKLMPTMNIALLVAFVAYVIMGDLISIIFVDGIHGDVLSVLPIDTLLPSTLRFGMILTIISSIPLILIPLSELVYDKLIANNNMDKKNDTTTNNKNKHLLIIRIVIAIACAIVSVEVPNFIYVISFLGCCCNAAISFAFPPLLHVQCYKKFVSSGQQPKKPSKYYTLDLVLIVLGTLVSAFSSVLTFKSMMEQIRNSTA